uniref:Uncharacterized protein n=1 Tax=Arundo donax TaxID=35708 RepID=A0A0A8XQ69_ARUDO
MGSSLLHPQLRACLLHLARSGRKSSVQPGTEQPKAKASFGHHRYPHEWSRGENHHAILDDVDLRLFSQVLKVINS